MILGIDTSAGQCAAALVSGDRIVRRAEPMARGHAEALMPMIEDLLAAAGATFRDITRIGVCTGPGSFTGIRAGVAAARGMALGLGVPAVGVTRLQALAASSPEPVTVLIPTRGGEVARQDFRDGRPTSGPRLTTDHAPSPGHTRAGAAEGEEPLADPALIARVAGRTEAGDRPAPLYLRPADAAPSRVAAPTILP